MRGCARRGRCADATGRERRADAPAPLAPSALALALGALAADVAPQPAGRHGLVVAVAALAVVALAQALLRRAADRPVGGIVVPVAASSALWVMGAVTLSAPSGGAGPSAVDVALLGVLLAAPAAVGAAVVAQLARIRKAGRLPDGLAAAYLLAPLLTGLLLDLPAGARLAAGAVPGWAPGVVYGILLLTALGALLTRRAQAPSFWVLVTRVAVLPLTAELAVRLLDSGVGIAWTVTVVLLAQHAVSWAIQRRPPIATRDRVLAWILLGVQAATALLLWLLVPGGSAALSAAAMLLLTAAAAWVYEARRTIPGYALLPHVLAPAALAAADGASQALAPRTDQTAVLGALGILVAVLISLSARILREGAGRGAGRPGAVGELVWLGLLFLGGIVPDRTGWVACIGLALAAWILLLLLRDAAPRSGAAAAGPRPLPMAELRRHVVVWTGLLILLRLLGYVFDGPQPVLWPLLAGVALMGLALGSRVEAPQRSRAYLWFAFGAETLAWLVSIADPAVGGPVAPLWGLGIPALLIAALVLGMVAAVLTRDTAAGWAWAALITAVLLWYARNLGPLLLIILALAITGAVIWFLLRTGRRS
ncbi:hypothetical protein NBM05_02525 [Rothia sp. AR01]|uniref:DUF2339 domain-containing protein n=1 Tax=Rothia santali TaxID=2949643 RepID=A0A9X2HIN3_9MICC|nr:hypothetical protein [Rothia santali]MCP3424933.1 hypothetical protein [Rothia santali]